MIDKKVDNRERHIKALVRNSKKVSTLHEEISKMHITDERRAGELASALVQVFVLNEREGPNADPA